VREARKNPELSFKKTIKTIKTIKTEGRRGQSPWYSYQTVAVPRMSAYFRERTGSGKSSHRFIPLSQLF
jgi:hypothetical protein